MALCVIMMTITVNHAEGSEQQETIPHPNPKPGSWWIIQRSNESSPFKIELIRIEDGKFITQVGEREINFTDEWNALEGPNPMNGAWLTYTPHNHHLSFPLWEGKRWKGKFSWSNDKNTGSVNSESAVIRWEMVTVTAGTFRALKIETTIVSGKTKIQTTCWYAPEVQRFAKCTNDHSSSEIINYYLAQ